MHAFTMLKWTATILLVYISECHGHSVCVYSFHVPNSHDESGCPGNGQSLEVLRLAESLTQVQHVVEQLKSAIDVLQVIMRVTRYLGLHSSSLMLVSHSGEYSELAYECNSPPIRNDRNVIAIHP